MLVRTFLGAIAASLIATAASAQTPDVTGALQWRPIGPFRGGWSTIAVGIAEQSDTFYFGAAGGGVWKSEDAGASWHSLGDQLGAASVGAMAIAPSDAGTIYVGTGQVEPRYDVAAGNGVYKSSDGGKTWNSVGLVATRHIGAILVDPRKADNVLVGALGHYFGANKERGVYKSTDGGKTWQQTLFVDDKTGVVDLAADPANPDVIYAAAWQARNWPWLSYFQPNAGPGSGVYKSSDGGSTWKRITGNGWPTANLGRIGLATSTGGRVYAVVKVSPGSGNVHHAAHEDEGGLYVSDDAGATWKLASKESWLQNDYFARITVDPGNRDRLYSAGQSIRRSDDAGKTWTIAKGAPGGDDYHYLWINPKHPERMVAASDQGTTVSVDDGKSWSDWYNQPTGQFYHLAADNRFPYWVYSGQQDSGTIGTSTRSDYGALSFRDWNPVGGDERDYDIPDPQDANIIYGSGLGGRLSRWDKRTGEVQNIAPWPTSVSYGGRPTAFKYRYTWITPIAVSQKPPYPLYQGAQVLFRSLDRGNTWSVISPDLSAKDANAKDCAGDLAPAQARACGYGVIFSIGLSPRDNDEIWIGTDDGTIRRTRDGGKQWDNVTPKEVPAWGKVSSMDVAATAPDSAYVAIDNHRQDDFRPLVLRTHDGGKTWTDISKGLPANQFVAVVRADPVKGGLLYAGTETGVFVSFDDGAHWQSLRNNLPTALVNDLLVHGDDLIAATQGRAIWILDDVAPLRQHELAAKSAPMLFEPAIAIRVRGSQGRDTPPPADTALGENPPTGAIIDYQLPAKAKQVTLEIRQGGKLVRRFASEAKEAAPEAERYFSEGWVSPPQQVSADAGAHRFVWDLRSERPRAVHFDFGINAVYREGTPIAPQGMLVAPGEYDVVLNVDGKSVQTKLKVTADPRALADVQTLPAAAAFGHDVYAALERDFVGYGELHAVDAQIAKVEKNAPPAELHAAIEKFKEATKPLSSGEGDSNENLDAIGELLSGIANDVEASDRTPTQPQRDLLAATNARLERAQARWNGIKQGELAQLDAALKAAGQAEIKVPAADQISLNDAPESKDLP
jgi:photosystem II stability/assembly factor-like uncharacterized protein